MLTRKRQGCNLKCAQFPPWIQPAVHPGFTLSAFFFHLLCNKTRRTIPLDTPSQTCGWTRKPAFAKRLCYSATNTLVEMVRFRRATFYSATNTFGYKVYPRRDPAASTSSRPVPVLKWPMKWLAQRTTRTVRKRSQATTERQCPRIARCGPNTGDWWRGFVAPQQFTNFFSLAYRYMKFNNLNARPILPYLN